MRILKNRTKPRIPYYLVLIWNLTKPGTALIKTILTGAPLYTILDTKKSIFCKHNHNSNTHQISSWLNKIMFGSNVKLVVIKKDPQRIWSITNWLKAFASWISQEQIELKMV